MATRQHGLGRGLDALIKDGMPTAAAEAGGRSILRVPLGAVRKSPLQPRRSFESEAMAELTQSVRERGVLQPLLVRAAGSEYELTAGERRLRAATEAGLADVPVIVMTAADPDALEMALIENLQREDLNVIEEAEGYQILAEKFGHTQEQIAARVGKARASVANALRLLALPAEVKQMVVTRQLSAGHAKVLSGLEIPEEQALYARRAARENLSVRNLEKIIERARRAPRKPRASRTDIPPSHVALLSDKLHAHFGTSVRLTPCRTYANGTKGKGIIEIDFFSNDDLDRILSLLGVSAE
jgi:ParB family transcriptional regulator, chromosome partitioning protein